MKRPFSLPTRVGNSRGARSVQKILEAAARKFGREGFQAASMHAVARAAGVSKGLLHYHFHSKEHLLLETQRATFREVYEHFRQRFSKGERGVDTALDGLDALWKAIVGLHHWTPFMVETMAQTTGDRPLRDDVDAFYDEAMGMLEDGIREAFADDMQRLTVAPDRLAVIVRVGMHGLVVELARARTTEEVAEVERAYLDLRQMFAQAVLNPVRSLESPT